MARTPEKDLETRILNWLNSIEGCFAIKINTTGIFDPVRKVYRKNTNPHIHNGTSDILGLYKGSFFAIEVKVGRNKASDAQKLFLKRILNNGGKAWITRDYEQCKRLFVEAFDRPKYSATQIGEKLSIEENY